MKRNIEQTNQPRTVSFADDMVVVYTIPRIESSAVKKDLFYVRSDFQRFKKEEKQRENRVMLQQIHRGLHPAATYEDKMLAKELLTMLEMRAGPENRAELLKSIAFAIARITRKQQNRKDAAHQEKESCGAKQSYDTTPTLPNRVVDVESKTITEDRNTSSPMTLVKKPIRRNAACHCTNPDVEVREETDLVERKNAVVDTASISQGTKHTREPKSSFTYGTLRVLLPSPYIALNDSLQQLGITGESEKESVQKPRPIERLEMNTIKSGLRAGKTEALKNLKSGSNIRAICTIPQCIEMPVRQLNNAKAA